MKRFLLTILTLSLLAAACPAGITAEGILSFDETEPPPIPQEEAAGEEEGAEPEAPAEETEDEAVPAAPAEPAVSEDGVPIAQPGIPRDLPPTGERYCDSQPFGIRNGSRDVKRVAITVDDCYERDKVEAIFELIQANGGRCTFFPLGDQLKVADRALWRRIAASDFEIGSHTNHHTKMTVMSRSGILIHLYRVQELLDEVLGYHYGIVSLRPPFGDVRDSDGRFNRTVMSVCQNYGYQHVVLWDVSQTDAQKAMKAVKNGSILLFHARTHDYRCLETLVPWLVEQGYELVTVRELLEFDYIETGSELYVHER